MSEPANILAAVNAIALARHDTDHNELLFYVYFWDVKRDRLCDYRCLCSCQIPGTSRHEAGHNIKYCFTFIVLYLLPHNVTILYFRLPYLHVSNSS